MENKMWLFEKKWYIKGKVVYLWPFVIFTLILGGIILLDKVIP